MRPFIVVSFLTWIVKKIFLKVIDRDHTFKKLLRREPWVGLLAWFACSALGLIAVLMVAFPLANNLNQISTTIAVYATVSGLYLVTTGVTILFEAFKKERNELFETLKG